MRQVTIGIVGLGSIGRNVARLALAFGARVIGTRKEPDERKDFTESMPEGMERILRHDQLPELLAESDFVVLAVPLTSETDSLMNGPRLALMKPGSWLINVARGRLVDQRALLRALRNGPLEGAILDTIWEEPLPPSSPLWDAPGLYITPHTSWSSGRVLDRSIELFCDNLACYRDGREMLNLVDPAAGY
jgi:phosphoglycerate dehydrogenase-like enzyme